MVYTCIKFSEIINIKKQECIPVGCVPSAAVAVSRGGGLFRGGCGCVSAPWGGVCSRGVSSGGCLLPGVCLLLGVSAPGGVCSQGGVCSGGCLLQGMSALGGCGIPAWTEADTPPPPPWTDRRL